MGRDQDDMRNNFFSRPTEIHRPGTDDGTVTNDRAYPANAPTVGPGNLAAPTDQPEALNRRGHAGNEPATRLYRPVIDAATSAATAQPAEIVPVTAWLVVVEGPGKGHARALGYGVNNIGRGADARVRLDFGDEEMSRSAHCAVIYDGRNRRFYIQQGSGNNLTYVDGAPILAPRPLEGGERIDIGLTSLRFVPLCGRDFDWTPDGERP